MNDMVYKTGSDDQNIYVIVQGEVEINIQKNLQKTTEIVKRDNFNHEKNEFEFDVNDYKIGYRQKKYVSLLKIGPENYFGDEDGFNTKKKAFNAKVISNNCKLFLIPKDKIAMNIKDQSLLQTILTVGNLRKEMMIKRDEFLKNVKFDEYNYYQIRAEDARNAKHRTSQDKLDNDANVGYRGFINQMSQRNQHRNVMRQKKLERSEKDNDQKSLNSVGEYLGKIRTNLRTIDNNFDNCFSNVFNDPKIVERLKKRNKKRETQSVRHPTAIPREAKVDSMQMNLRRIRRID